MKNLVKDAIVIALFGLLAAFCVAKAFGQPQAPPVAPMPPQAPPVRTESYDGVTYSSVMAECIKKNRIGVVFVGPYAARPLTDLGIVKVAQSVEVDRLEGYPAQCIVICAPENGVMVWKATLPIGAKSAEIKAAIEGRQVQPMARPFIENPYREQAVTADDSGPWLAVSEQERLKAIWPASVEFPTGMKFYRPTQRSQRIAVTDGRDSNQWYHKNRDDVWQNALTSFNPNRTDKRWVAPGGLADVSGWTHAPAIYLPESPRVFTQRIQIANGGMLPAKRWTFPDWTIAADLLMKDGRAFELRVREKNGGKWESYVAFKDRDARPAGYHGAGRACAECHADGPGISEQYGITVRGCDGVFSFNPFD